MKRTSLLSLLFSVCCILTYGQKKVASPKEFFLLVGTYTAKTSEGVYCYKFNAKTGDFEYASTAKGLKNPSFLTVSPNKKMVYTVGEYDKVGAVNALKVNDKTGELTFVNTQPAGGGASCHITTDKTGKWILVGNYTGGDLSILPINADGSVGVLKQTIQHKGSSVNKDRQTAPHVHSVNIAANNRDVFVPDLGLDKIMTYSLDAKTGALTAGNPAFTAVEAGAGPRHFCFHPNNKFAYSIQELNSSVNVYDYKNGALTEKQMISTLPDSYTGQKWCADIHISADGKFLYASNRGHQSLTIYSVDPQTGKLTWVDNTSVLGKTPRNFTIDPTGNFVLVANQDTDNIVIFKRDKTTGKITPTGKEITVSMPVCLQWLPKK